MKENSRLGDNIRIARAVRKLSQAELAKQAELDQSYISRIEAGYTPSQEALVAIARVLHLSPAELEGNSLEEVTKSAFQSRIKPTNSNFRPEEKEDIEKARAYIEEAHLTLSETVKRLTKNRRTPKITSK